MQPVVVQSSAPNIVVRVIWFLFIGLWLGAFVATLAWACNLTIVGLPLGLWLINRLPTIVTLRPQEQAWRIEAGVLRKGERQHSWLLRLPYFLLVGWWFSAVWIVVAYAALATVVLLPAAFWMFGRIGAVTTLYRS